MRFYLYNLLVFAIAVVGVESKPPPASGQTLARISHQPSTTSPNTGTGISGLVMKGTSENAQLLNKWYGEGTAVGHKDVYYDNRDHNHSRIRISEYPQLKAITYSEKQKQAKADYGVQRQILPNIVVGNSSTSSNMWSVGSQARLLYGTPQNGLAFLHTQYRSNNLYIYPEHRDHDSGNGGFPGHGDLYMANSPYLLISQGSSGSDRKFLHACFQTLAAFNPKIKQELTRTGAIMPTLQAVLRKSYKRLKTPDDYLTGAAHPTVFNGNDLATNKMIRMAHEMEFKTIPPIVSLHIVEDDQLDHTHTFLDSKRSEIHADTPASIARIFRRTTASMKLTVSAEQSQDALGRKLQYHWVVLRGDPETITIKERLNGAIAEITVPYPARSPITPNSHMESNRIDIGVFVSVDGNFSAPAFITFFGLDNERRIYNRFGRLYSIAYDAKHEFNLPLPKDIERWHRLMRLFLFEQTKDNERIQILFPTLSPSQIKFITDQAPELSSLYDKYVSVQKKIKAVPDGANKKNLKNERLAIKNQYQHKMEKQDSKTQRTIIDMLRKALRETTMNPQFYLQNKKAIDRFLAKAKPDHQKRFKTELKSMTLHGYYKHEVPLFADDKYSLPSDFPHNPVYSNSRYQDFHATVISTALAPGLFPMPKRGNCVDPRLSKAKPFRDVFHYDSTGLLKGWTRYSKDGQKQFNQSAYTDQQ